MLNVFISYSHNDERQLSKLKKHLSPLRRNKLIAEWTDRNISPGKNFGDAIDQHLSGASIILLFVTADFINSDYCYDVELLQALAQHDNGVSRVIPIIAKPCAWHSLPFGNLLALPKDGKAITTWGNQDAAYLNVVNGIEQTINELTSDLEAFAESQPPILLPNTVDPYPMPGTGASLVSKEVHMPIEIETFSTISLADPFFDSLKQDYPGFEKWFHSKAQEKALVTRNQNNEIDGFLYLKVEEGAVSDVVPALPAGKRIKIGTFKVDPRGTKFGERFLKKALDYAVARGADELYVTILPKHDGLIRLFTAHGFTEVARKDGTACDVEIVLLRRLRNDTGDILLDYPLIHVSNANKYLLAIYPQWHTQLLPDSKLYNEDYDSVRDLSETNSIHKVYICWMDIDCLKKGDVIVIYRTKDPSSNSAEYSAVATSICVVEDVRRTNTFASDQAFIEYCGPYSVFSNAELHDYYNRPGTRVLKFTYNTALSKRIIRKRLIEEVGLDRDQRWSFFQLSDSQFDEITRIGGVHEGLIVD